MGGRFGEKVETFFLEFMRNTTRENIFRLDKQQTIAINKVLRRSYKLLSDSTKQKIESLFHTSLFPESIEITVRRNIAKEDVYLELLYHSLDKAFSGVLNDFYETWTKTMQFCFTKESFPEFEEKYLKTIVDENMAELPTGILRYQILANMGEGGHLKNTTGEVLNRLRIHFTNESAKEQKTDDEIKNAIVATLGLLSEDVKTKILSMAKEFGEESGEFYFAFVKGKMPWGLDAHTKGSQPVWDWIKEYLKEDDTCKTLFSKEFTIEALKAHRKHLIQQLSIRWKHRLSDPTKNILAKLETEFGEKFELSTAELIRADQFTREEFEKREKEKWLPQLRKMSAKLAAKNDSLHI